MPELTRPPVVPPVRLLAHVHLYPPSHNAGAEWMLHAMLRRLGQADGFQAKVITSRPPRRRNSFQGIPVEHTASPARAQVFYRWANVALTHLDVTRQAMGLARRRGVPLVHLVHNHQQLEFHQVQPKDAALVIWNSEWVAAKAGADWTGPSMVVTPPVWCADYARPVDEPYGDAVTLLNLAEAKGAHLFYALARRLPDVPFLGVRGAYGEQVDPPEDLPNVTILPNQPDVRKVYARTRVLLMPSTYESFGRCAVEAAAAGVPSIGSDATGLVEAGCNWQNLPLHIEARPSVSGFARASALGDKATTDLWAEALVRLYDDPDVWAAASIAAQDRALQLEQVSIAQHAELLARLRGLV